MLSALKFVQGAVAKKDFVPSLTHFRIEAGKVLGHNGSIALCSPIDLTLECSPRAKPFVKAIETCTDTIQLNMTPAGRLAVKSGDFGALIECSPEPYPVISPDGNEVNLPKDFMPSLRILAPFIAEDASRPWAQGILFRDQSAFATNNIILVEKWLGENFPNINVPKDAVTELLRIGEDPIRIQTGESSITFHYEGGRWLRSQLLTTDWPDLGAVLDAANMSFEAMIEVPPKMFKAMEALIPFVDDLERCFLRGGKISTSMSDEEGATVQVPGTPDKGCFNIKQMMLLEKVATKVNFDAYPSPCTFFGANMVRGAIVGMFTP